MSRKKVRLQWIANDAHRRATYKKRKKGILKKVEELSVLCDVKACAVIYGPDDPEPAVWPNVEEAAAILRTFRSLPEVEQSKKMLNQEGFLRQQITKVREQIKKETKANKKLETELLMYMCLAGKKSFRELTAEERTDVSRAVDDRLKALHDRIEVLRADQQRAPEAVATATVTTAADQASSSYSHPPPPPLPPPPQVAGATYQQYYLHPVLPPRLPVAEAGYQLPYYSHPVPPTPAPVVGGARQEVMGVHAAAAGMGSTGMFRMDAAAEEARRRHAAATSAAGMGSAGMFQMDAAAEEARRRHAAATSVAGMGRGMFPGLIPPMDAAAAAAAEARRRQEYWYMQMMVPPNEQYRYGGVEAALQHQQQQQQHHHHHQQPFGDDSEDPWMDPYYPYN